jgi:hypothetical protein
MEAAGCRRSLQAGIWRPLCLLSGTYVLAVYVALGKLLNLAGAKLPNLTREDVSLNSFIYPESNY